MKIFKWGDTAVEKKLIKLDKVVYLYMAWNWKNEMILTKWANVDKADKVALKFWKDWSSEIKKFFF